MFELTFFFTLVRKEEIVRLRNDGGAITIVETQPGGRSMPFFMRGAFTLTACTCVFPIALNFQSAYLGLADPQNQNKLFKPAMQSTF